MTRFTLSESLPTCPHSAPVCDLLWRSGEVPPIVTGGRAFFSRQLHDPTAGSAAPGV